MALTATRLAVYRGQGQADLVTIKVVTALNDYPTGGYPITPAQFGFSAFETDGLGTGLPPTAGSYQVLGDGQGTPYSGINPANGNLQMFVASTGAENTNASNAAGLTFFLEALGH